ncbi:MAG: amidohydrolase family protein [Ktedonobacteraceae bacterium]|nr:amidohydrolase family protein [Ktedonobacteraceae bacterium]
MVAYSIVDTHVHLWNPEHFRMSWVDGDALLNRRYTVDVYSEHTAGIPVEAMVFVECGVEPQYAYLEAQWAVACARADARIQGIVAACPVEFGSRARSYVEALVALDPRIKGVRRNIQDEQDADFCLQPDFVHGVQLLATYSLSFDLCIRHWQLPAAIALVRRCPDTQFILDHMGKPDVKGHQLDPWRNQLHELAALPNVACKISGLVTEADLSAWTGDELAPYVAHVLEVFGEDRVTFGGDWPVALLASPYIRWFETAQVLTASLPETAQRKLWNENARRLYRLENA